MHASAIIRTIGKAVEGAEQLQEVLSVLARLGRTHANLFVKQDYFAVLRDCLLEALVEHLGRDTFTDAVEEAWAAAFDGIASVIIGCYPTSGVFSPDRGGSQEGLSPPAE